MTVAAVYDRQRLRTTSVLLRLTQPPLHRNGACRARYSDRQILYNRSDHLSSHSKEGVLTDSSVASENPTHAH
jgi:hypothetical protein